MWPKTINRGELIHINKEAHQAFVAIGNAIHRHFIPHTVDETTMATMLVHHISVKEIICKNVFLKFWGVAWDAHLQVHNN